MITEDEVMSLFEHADPARADRPASTEPAERDIAPPALGDELLEVDPGDLHVIEGRRSRGRLLVAAGLVLAIVAAGVLFRLSSDDGATTSDGLMSDDTPSVTPAPDAGVRRFPLPAVGSTPSAPVRGERVFSLEACGGPSSVPGWSGNLVLYADGRLLWHSFADPPEGGVTPSPTTSWLEQRLTPEGVELMQSELAASGLPFHRVFDHCPTGSYLLKTGDRSHERYFVGAPPDELVERISDPASWLPSRAWEDRRVRPFVPARYSVCFSGEDPRIAMTELADSLPAPVGDLVRARSWGENHYGPSRWVWCSTGTTDSARTFIEAIEAAGLDPSEHHRLLLSLVSGPGYQFDYQHGERSELIQLTFQPELPDGPW